MKAIYRNYGCRITDDLIYKSMRVIYLENELIKIGILLDKGADIFTFLYKPTDTDFMWHSPNGLVDPKKFKETIASSSGSFLDNYHGGWQDIFPGGGPAGYKGAELGLHGEITQLSWDYEILDDRPECIKIRLETACIRTPFKVEKTIEIRSKNTALFIEETITNLSNEDIDFMWGQHPAIGAPFLKEGVKIHIPAKKMEIHSPKFIESSILEPGKEFDWPIAISEKGPIDLSIVQSSNTGIADLIYIKELQSGWYAVMDPESQLGIGFTWPKDIFPYIWFWFVYGRAPGYPWWNRAYCMALEPWTSIPNNLDQAIERDMTKVIKGGEKIKVPLTAIIISDRGTIRNIGLDGTLE